MYTIILFYGGFTVEKVRLLLPSSRSSFDKTCTKFACRILLYVLHFPIFSQQYKCTTRPCFLCLCRRFRSSLHLRHRNLLPPDDYLT